MKDKIEVKEVLIKQQLEQLRTKLNEGRIRYNQNPNDWYYFTALSHTEKQLKELLEYFNMEHSDTNLP